MSVSAILISVLVLLSACGTLVPVEKPPKDTQDPIPSPELEANTTKTSPPVAPKVTRPFPVDTFYDLLVAELAANRRDPKLAIRNYVKQAKATQDVEVIARAARMTQFFRDYAQSIEMSELWLNKAPTNIEALSLQTTAYIELNKPVDALNSAKRILALIKPEQTQALQQAAITETIANRSQGQAADVLNTLVSRYIALSEQYPDYPPITVGLSRLYELLGDKQAASSTIEQTLSEHSDYMPAVMQQVRLLQLDQQPEAAADKLQELLAQQPNNTRLQLVYARLLVQSDPDKAYAELTKLSSASPDEYDITFLRALVALEIDKLTVAHELLSELLTQNYRPNSVNFYLGKLESERDKPILALGHYLSVDQSEEFIEAQTLAGRIIAQKEGLKAAQQHFEDKRASSPRSRTQLYIAEANLLDQQGKKPLAIGALSEAIEQFPDDISLRYNRSTFYEQLDQLDLMEIDLRHILDIDPENASAMNALGYVLTNKTDRHQEALPLIERALELRPEDAAITDSMGWVLYRLGRYEESIVFLRKAFALFPDPEVAAHLGEVLWVVGEQQEAKKIWADTLEKNPDDAFITETMRRFNLEL